MIFRILKAMFSKKPKLPVPKKPLSLHQQWRDALVAIARKEVGATEVGGNNMGPEVRKYQSATWLPVGPWPWCAAFVGWCIMKANEEMGFAPFTGKRPRTAGAFDYEAWATNRHPETGKYMRRAGENVVVLDPSEPIKRGDLIIFTYSHIGIAVSGETPGGTFSIVEGNTGPQGNSRDGDGVWLKVKHHRTAKIRSIVRIGNHHA
jgi:hypothetical protein